MYAAQYLSLFIGLVERKMRGIKWDLEDWWCLQGIKLVSGPVSSRGILVGGVAPTYLRFFADRPP